MQTDIGLSPAYKQTCLNQNTTIHTLLCGKTINAPPPADSTIIAKNLGLTAQNVESQLLFDTRMLS